MSIGFFRSAVSAVSTGANRALNFARKRPVTAAVAATMSGSTLLYFGYGLFTAAGAATTTAVGVGAAATAAAGTNLTTLAAQAVTSAMPVVQSMINNDTLSSSSTGDAISNSSSSTGLDVPPASDPIFSLGPTIFSALAVAGLCAFGCWGFCPINCDRAPATDGNQRNRTYHSLADAAEAGAASTATLRP